MDMVGESGAVPLLLQSLVFTGDNDPAANAVVARINNIVWIFEGLGRAGCIDILAECGTAERLIALLPDLNQNWQQQSLVTAILTLVDTIVCESPLTRPAKLTALAHLLPYMLKVDEQDHVRAGYDNNYYTALSKVLFTLVSSKISGPVTLTTSVSQIPYATVSFFVPLGRNIIRRYLSPDVARDGPETRLVLNHAYSALHSLFECSSSGSEIEAAQRHEDLVGFVTSADFEPLLNLSDSDDLQKLQKFLNIFDDTVFACAFTDKRVKRFLLNISPAKTYSMKELSLFMGIFATVATRFPDFTEKILWTDEFARITEIVNDLFTDRHFWSYQSLPINIALSFERILITSSDASRAAQHLLSSGAVDICCMFLTRFLMSQRSPEERPDKEWPSAAHLVQLLRFLRELIRAGDLLIDPKDCSAMPCNNPIVAEFIVNRGPQALELLLYDNCMQWDDHDAILHELTELRALLMGIKTVGLDRITIAMTEEMRLQTLTETRSFMLPHNKWQVAFEAHIACSLEESGFPRRVKLDSRSQTYVPLPAQTRYHGAPSAAALALLQAWARERVLVHARNQRQNGSSYGSSLTEVKMVMKLSGTRSEQDALYRLVIRLNNQRFPCNAAHFYTAAHQHALSDTLHTCYVPLGQDTAASLPFVTLCNSHSQSCATAPLELLVSDIVYGEYTGANTSNLAEYPIGTVLMCPGSVTPKIGPRDASRTPWFIVFKPCPMGLLRGAVPVGRVVSCIERDEPATLDNWHSPFDTTVLKCFAMRCQAESCRSGAHITNVSISHP